MINDGIIASSFRDPSGFVFYKNNEIYRQVNKVYQKGLRFIYRIRAVRRTYRRKFGSTT